MDSQKMTDLLAIDIRMTTLRDEIDNNFDQFKMLDSADTNTKNNALKKVKDSVYKSAEFIELATKKHNILVSQLPGDVQEDFLLKEEDEIVIEFPRKTARKKAKKWVG